MPLLRGFDSGRALLALTLAAALWWLITAEQNPERNELFPTPIPVEIINAPPSLVVSGEVPLLQAQVRAPAEAWSRLRASSFRATADASRAGPGGNELPVVLEPLDPAVRGVEPIPPRITVMMEERGERSVPVRVNLTGSVPFGYSSGQARVATDHVTAIGPVSVLQRVQEALVEISLDQLTLSLNNTFQLIPVDARRERVPGVRLNPPSVSVEVPVSQQVSYKEVGIRPIIRGRAAPGYYLEPLEINPPTATIVGEPGVLAAINLVETEPIDVNGLSATSVKQAFLQTPAGVTFLAPRPVTVTVKVTPLPTTQVLQVVPTVVGLGAGLQLADPVSPVEVTISGPAPTLQGLSARDFRVTLDLTGRGPGQYTIALQPQIPASFRLEATNPTAMSVTITVQPTPTPVATLVPTS